MMNDFLITRILPGYDYPKTQIFKSDKKNILEILRDCELQELGYESVKEFEEYEGQTLSLEDIQLQYFASEDLICLLVNLDTKKILVENGDIIQ